MDSISDDIVTEIKDSLQQLELDSSIQTYASKKEFKEVLSESSSGNQTIFCVIKLKRKGDHDDGSSRSSPYVMFHSTKLFKVLSTGKEMNSFSYFSALFIPFSRKVN